MSFIWTDFGVLDKCSYDSYGNLFVHNTENESRKMSAKYSSIFNQIEQKCQLLQGKFVQIRTSQNTGAWSTLQWFSDISLSGTDVNWTAPSGAHIENPDELKEKVEKLTQERDKAEEGEFLANQSLMYANQELQEALDREYESEVREYFETTEAAERESLANHRANLAEERLVQVTAQRDAIEITLDMLLAGGETIACEFKKSLSLDVNKVKHNKTYNPKKEEEIETATLKTLVGFLNAEGGTLLIGVADSKEALGIDSELEKLHHSVDKYKSLDNLKLHLTTLINQRISKSALANYMVITTPKHKNGSTLVRIEVKKSLPGPVFLKPGDDFYVRFPASTEKLTGSDFTKYYNQHWNLLDRQV